MQNTIRNKSTNVSELVPEFAIKVCIVNLMLDNPSEYLRFTRTEINYRLQKNFPDMFSPSQVDEVLNDLVQCRELSQPEEDVYKLIEGEKLHLRLQLGWSQRELDECQQKLKDIKQPS